MEKEKFMSNPRVPDDDHPAHNPNNPADNPRNKPDKQSNTCAARRYSLF